MLSRFTVMMCVSIAVVGGKLRFLSGRPRDLRHCVFHRSFCFLGTNYCLFSTIATAVLLGDRERFLLMGVSSFLFSKSLV